ncbi:MAG: hypothetical protein K2M63_01850 [Muribaculaceae bacterium]|nr:hypothetical protein [Bacteroides sp.]MDE6226246.1 hypothetical protein [Muribaculaceae bacterium]
MNQIEKILENDENGMSTYEYIVNNVDTCSEDLPVLIENLKKVDRTGQFLSSTARFLNAVDSEGFASYLSPLLEGAIEKDRERRYIGSLLQAIWGDDYMERAAELRLSDDNFRRIYKRIYPASGTEMHHNI